MDFTSLFTNLPTLETERLQLRPFKLEDAGDVFAWASDPEVWVHTPVETPSVLEDSYKRITRHLEQAAQGKTAVFAVVLKETGRVIGEALVFPLHRAGSVSIGYDIARAYWNRGYATEATRALIGYCFDIPGMNRVEAMCSPENLASLKVMLKAGMAYEGTLRRYALVKGNFVDLSVCSILRQEWAGESAPPGEPTRRPMGQPGGEITELFNHMPVLGTGRLRLRRLRVEDVSDVFDYASDPQVARYVMFEPHQSPDDSRAFLERVLSRPTGSGVMIFGMEHRETGKLLGHISIFLDSEADARAEIAYALNRSFWGQGYTTEAASALIDHGFRHLRLHRIQATCYPENVPSARVLEKSGMTYEGTLRQYMLIKGKYRDLKMYSILRREWEVS